MPGKHSLLAQLDRYSKEFIIARMKLLHIFLNRIVNHPILSCDGNLHLFLTAKSTVRSIVILMFTWVNEKLIYTSYYRSFWYTERTAMQLAKLLIP